MSDGTYALTFSGFDTAIEDAQRLAATFQSTLEEMNSNLANSLATWTGPAQDEYKATYTKVYNTALQMPAALTTVQQTMVEIANGYSTAETNVARTFSR
jgi:WXG100 family type VII secretion target